MKTRCFNLLLLFGLISIGFLNTSFGQSSQDQDRAIISPSLIHLKPGQEQQFKIVLKATRLMPARNPEVVKWAVNDIVGGNKVFGTISKDGIYLAPDKIPQPREIHVSGYTEEAQNNILYATVIVGDSPVRYKSVLIWTKKLNDPESKMKSPHGLGLDKEGNILIADEIADRVFRYTMEGKFLNEIGNGPGENPGQFKAPREVRSDTEGNIFVTDSKGDDARIQVFNHQGEFLRIFGEKGRGPGQILRAHGIGFDPEQRLFINDVDNMRVNVYDASGKFLYDFDGWEAYKNMNVGEMNAPHGIFVDPAGDVFVVSYYGPTHKFTPEGNILNVFAHGDPPDGSVYFHNITGDRWGNIYLLVRGKGGDQQAILKSGQGKRISILKYNNNADFVTEWSFSDPNHRETTAAVDSDGVVYALFVTETEMGVEIFIEE
jgi:DNA-binding beta-propeller fold protein YncE